MKCPKKECDGEMKYGVCKCGLVKDSPAYVDAVNVLLEDAIEEEDAPVGW